MKVLLALMTLVILLVSAFVDYRITFEVLGFITWSCLVLYSALILVFRLLSKVKRDKETIRLVSEFKAFNRALHSVRNEERD